jgi:hypothetical protein
MAVVFLEGGTSPIPMQMASTTVYRGPGWGVCQFANSRKQRRTNPEHKLLLNLSFLATLSTTRLKYHQTHLSKTNNDCCQN